MENVPFTPFRLATFGFLHMWKSQNVSTETFFVCHVLVLNSM